LYYRTKSADFGQKEWKRLADANEIPTVTDYYWANVKISSEANSGTSPTFDTITVTSNVKANGIITTKTGNSGGIKFGTSSLTSLDNCLLWKSDKAIRFGSSEWDWN
jgi:hypothetical protein